ADAWPVWIGERDFFPELGLERQVRGDEREGRSLEAGIRLEDGPRRERERLVRQRAGRDWHQDVLSSIVVEIDPCGQRKETVLIAEDAGRAEAEVRREHELLPGIDKRPERVIEEAGLHRVREAVSIDVQKYDPAAGPHDREFGVEHLPVPVFSARE